MVQLCNSIILLNVSGQRMQIKKNVKGTNKINGKMMWNLRQIQEKLSN